MEPYSIHCRSISIQAASIRDLSFNCFSVHWKETIKERSVQKVRTVESPGRKRPKARHLINNTSNRKQRRNIPEKYCIHRRPKLECRTFFWKSTNSANRLMTRPAAAVTAAVRLPRHSLSVTAPPRHRRRTSNLEVFVWERKTYGSRQ